MLAVSRLGGRIRPQVPFVKSVASALCIGTGGSVGREGPIVQIGSALGSVLGQAARVSDQRLRLLVACGAGAGISATFNAPIAGVFFALEVILRDFETQSFGVVVLSSITAAAVGRAAFGSTARFYTCPHSAFPSSVEYPLFAVLGVLAAVWGVVFIRVLYGSEDLADRIWRGPEWGPRPESAAVLGLLLIALPEMYGVGYPVLERAVDGRYAAGFLIVLLVGKTFATSLTMSIGGSGGVFAPSLFMGAMVGSAYGQAIHSLFPHASSSAGAYGLVGVGAVFAASARAPITAVLIIYELTGEYSTILPLMLAIVLATAISARLSPDTIYTLKPRRGIDAQLRIRPLLADVLVRDAMNRTPDPIAGTTPLQDVLDRFATAPVTALPVIDAQRHLLGVITATDLESVLDDHRPTPINAADLAHTPPLIHPDDPLDDAIQALGHADEHGLPVVDRSDNTIVGVDRAARHPRDLPRPSQPSQKNRPTLITLRRSAAPGKRRTERRTPPLTQLVRPP